MRLSRWMLLTPVVAGTVAVATGCGSTPSLGSGFMSVNSATKTVTFKVVAGYTTTNDYLNYDGYANGNMTITVPVGYHVKLDYYNNGGTPADLGVYNNQDQLAFSGAGDSIQNINLNPQPGIPPGGSETISFTPTKSGTYKMANYENRFPTIHPRYHDVGMWDVFKVVQSGSPSIGPTS